MTREDALALRDAAGQPREWSGEMPPLSRVTLTLLILRACAEEDLATTSWDVPLLKPERLEQDTDYAFGDAISAVIDSVFERLGSTGGWQPGADLTLGQLILEIELVFLERWEHLARVDDPEGDALAAIQRARETTVEPETTLRSLFPGHHLQAFWQRLEEPWDSLLPVVRSERCAWPLPWQAVGFLLLGVALSAALLLWQSESLRIRLFFVLVTVILCYSAAWNRLAWRWEWPATLTTVGDLVTVLAENYRAERARLDTLEKEFAG